MVIARGLAALALLAGCSAVAERGAQAPATANPALAGEALFVANKRGDSLSRIDLATGEEERRVDACAQPHELALSPDGQHIALACYGGTSIAVFRADDLERVRQIELGDNARPHGIVWHPSGALLATAEGRRSIVLVEDPLATNTALREIATGQEGSHMLAVAPDMSRAWTVDMGSGTVTLLDLREFRRVRSAEVGTEPEGLALSPDGRALWVSARGSDRAFELDPISLEVRREVRTGGFPLRLAIRPQGDYAITSDLADGALSVIALGSGKVVRTIPVSGSDASRQVTILFSADGERVYAAETAHDTVAEIDFAEGTVLRRIATGPGGDGLAITGGQSGGDGR